VDQVEDKEEGTEAKRSKQHFGKSDRTY